MSRATVVERLVNGGAVWSLPGSEFEVMWVGPGSAGMLFGFPRRPGGLVFKAEHDLLDREHRSLKEADAAVQAFCAEGDKPEVTL